MAAIITGTVKGPKLIDQLRQGMRKWIFNTSHYPKYGLLMDDILIEYEPVQEALRRLPQEVKDLRTYRILRAVQCSIRKEYLPKEQWTKFEENIRYLEPYIEEVNRENKERDEWDSK